MGDAVHCMTPAGGENPFGRTSIETFTNFSRRFIGVGANTALTDAAFLGRQIGQAGGWQGGITSEYEKEMRRYASEAVKMSFETAASQFKITELK